VLFRFDPFDQLDRFGQRQSILAMDATRNEDEVLVYFDAPGVDADDIDITVEKNAITVEATRRWFDTDVKTLTSERSQGTFKREIQLGDHLDTDQIEAKLDKGVLTLAIPVKEGTKPRPIEVKTVSASEDLDAKVKERASA
jgi:HSP20 family protein